MMMRKSFLDSHTVFNVIWMEVKVSKLQFAVPLEDLMSDVPQVFLHLFDKLVRRAAAEVPLCVLAQGHLQYDNNHYISATSVH